MSVPQCTHQFANDCAFCFKDKAHRPRWLERRCPPGFLCVHEIRCAPYDAALDSYRAKVQR